MDPLNANGHPLSSPVDIDGLSKKLEEAGMSGSSSSPPPEEENSASPLTAPSDDDDTIEGVKRLVADPDSPTSRLLEKAARRSLKGSNVGTPDGNKRFNFVNDIQRNSKLAQAAQAELHAAASGNHSPMDLASSSNGDSRASSTMGYLQHGVEIDRQTAVIDELDQDAGQESKINEGMANIIITRLKNGLKSAERVLSILQAFCSSETAYYKAMELASKVNLVGESDGPSLRQAMEACSDIPMLNAATHKAVAEALGEAVKGVQAVVGVLRTACEDIEQGAHSAQRNVHSCRRGLKANLGAHEEACRAFDAAMLERKKSGSGRSKGVEADPWVTEGRLVEQQAALQRALIQQRKYLAIAFKRVGELERRRITEVTQALQTCLRTYRGAVISVSQEAERLLDLLVGVDCEADLEAFSKVALNSVRNGDALSSKQSEMVDHLWRELATSAEIVRQGEAERQLTSGAWCSGFAVLTRAGFIHWFAAPKGGGPPSAWGPAGGPTETWNLSRSTFEPGDASAIRLSEPPEGMVKGWLGGRAKTLMLRTAEVEECMAWALDVREVMATVGR